MFIPYELSLISGSMSTFVGEGGVVSWRHIGVLLVGFCAISASAQKANTGRPLLLGAVTDTSGQPVVHAHVTWDLERVGTVTNEEGKFWLTWQRSDSIVLSVRRVGFQPTSVRLASPGDTGYAATVVMLPLPLRLDAMRTDARATDALTAAGFYQRMLDRQKGLNNGIFITPEEVEARRAPAIAFLLDKVPSLRILSHGRAQVPLGAGGNCAYTVYLDGKRMNALRYGSGGGIRADVWKAGVDLNELTSANSVAAIEVYPRASMAPAQYQSLSGSCGIIVIWTKA